MKKLLILILAPVLALLSACGSTKVDVDDDKSKTNISNEQDSSELASEPVPDDEMGEEKQIDSDKTNANPSESDSKIANWEKLTFQDVEELKTDILTEWSWDEVKNWDMVTVHYLWRFIDWSKFDASTDRNQPFDFTVWQWQVIQGWEVWLLWMKVWELRRIHVPYTMWYWEAARWPIPAKSTLIFDVQLLKIN